MKNLYILTIVLAVFSFSSCDVLEEPYMVDTSTNQNQNPDTSTNDTVRTYYQKILVEDFTGHKCQNCPRGHRTIEQLHNIYGDTMIAISIHCGYYSVPAASGTEFTYDFRTDVGDELGGDGVNDYYGFYGIQGYPAGLVQTLAKESLSGNDTWGGQVSTIDRSTCNIGIWIETEYDEPNHQASATIETEFLNDVTEPMNLTVYIIESGIINWQVDIDDPHVHVEDYEHNHVLRGSFNGTWGESISTGNLAGDKLVNTYTMDMGSDWVPENCAIVAFIYNSNTLEVLQVEEKHLIHE
ncbi:MAG: hypothetical protein C0594_07280 [Marinilabiliales bacterium]|nr:MAG: hypothetical protein C0594_07280 [Marinilabiliales bacterium]